MDEEEREEVFAIQQRNETAGLRVSLSMYAYSPTFVCQLFCRKFDNFGRNHIDSCPYKFSRENLASQGDRAGVWCFCFLGCKRQREKGKLWVGGNQKYKNRVWEWHWHWKLRILVTPSALDNALIGRRPPSLSCAPFIRISFPLPFTIRNNSK